MSATGFHRKGGVERLRVGRRLWRAHREGRNQLCGRSADSSRDAVRRGGDCATEHQKERNSWACLVVQC